MVEFGACHLDNTSAQKMETSGRCEPMLGSYTCSVMSNAVSLAKDSCFCPSPPWTNKFPHSPRPAFFTATLSVSRWRSLLRTARSASSFPAGLQGHVTLTPSRPSQMADEEVGRRQPEAEAATRKRMRGSGNVEKHEDMEAAAEAAAPRHRS